LRILNAGHRLLIFGYAAMNTLIADLILFFAVHSIGIVNAPWPDRMAARLGEWTWKDLYGLVAVAAATRQVLSAGQPARQLSNVKQAHSNLL
jgi:uncharacterized membrane protein